MTLSPTTDGRALLSSFLKRTKYAAFADASRSRRETWEDTCSRYETMMIEKFPQLTDDIVHAVSMIRDHRILPSMRALQFAGAAARKHPNRIFNCCFTPITSWLDIRDAFFHLLCGSGVGYSVQLHHVAQLPRIAGWRNATHSFRVDDTIEGWADALLHLLSTASDGQSRPIFDFTGIRPKGAPLHTSGGYAPGPDPLRVALSHVETILRDAAGGRLSTLQTHDILCHVANAVYAGGIRRAAMISFFSPSDYDMLTCKMTPDWYSHHRQRERANNSAVLLINDTSEADFWKVWLAVARTSSGCPGIYFTHSLEFLGNPCVEASLRAHGLCNLTVTSARNITSQAEFNARCAAASFLGTLQAAFTDFPVLQPSWKARAEEDALLGQSITGIGMGTLDDLNLREGAETVLAVNARTAANIGIRTAARTTLLKPEGTTSLVLGVPFGITGWYSRYFKRRVTLKKHEPGYLFLQQHAPQLLEDSQLDPDVAFLVIPVDTTQEPGFCRDQEGSPAMLQRIEKYYNEWVLPGHRRGVNPHTISATVSLHDHEWITTGQWLWERRHLVRALSFYPHFGAVHVQPPYEAIDAHTCARMIQDLPSHLDFSSMSENIDQVTPDVACGGASSCEIL